MAQAAGNPTIFPLASSVYWETSDVFGTIKMGTGQIVSGYTNDGAGSYHYRGVLQVQGTKPSFHDVVVTDGGVYILITKLAAEPIITGTSLDIQAGRLNGAWTRSSTVTQMNTLWAAASWVAGGTIQVNAPGWYLLPYNPLWANQAIDYGIAIRVNSTTNGTIFIATESYGAPQLRTFYPCVYPPTVGYDATNRRGVLSDAAKAELLKLKPQWTGSLEVIAHQNKADSTLSDIDLSEHVSLSSVGDWNNRVIKLPETWDLGQNKPGGMTLAISDDYDPEDLTGAEVQMRFMFTDEMGVSEEISGGKVRLKRVGRTVDGRIDCALDDVYGAVRESKPYVTSPINGTFVSYTSIPILELLFDMLVNTPRRLRTGFWDLSGDTEPGVYPGDWYYLFARFLCTWPRLDISTAYAEASSTTDLINLTARLLGLFIGTGHDGRILVFHPAVYRPSMRIWTINIDEAVVKGKAVIKNVIPYASALTTPDVDQYIIVRGRTPLSNVEMGTHIETIPIDTTLFDVAAVRKQVKYGNLNQLSYRYTDESRELTMVTNHQGLPWTQGDVLLVTSDIYNVSADPFVILAKEGAPADTEVKVSAYHWPYWHGAKSLFQTDTPRGIWRWSSHLQTFNGENTAWGAGKGIGITAMFTIATGTPYLIFEEWGGAIVYDPSVNYVVIDAPVAITSDIKSMDVLEIPCGVKGIPFGFTVDATKQDWWVLMWKETGTNNALCIFIHRDPFTGGLKDGCAEKSCWGLGYTTNYTAATIVWQWSILAPPGVGYDGGAGGTNWDLDYLGVQLESSNIVFYIDGKEVGRHAWTRNNNLDDIWIRCSGNAKTMFGRLRLLTMANRDLYDGELVEENGADPFYA